MAMPRARPASSKDPRDPHVAGPGQRDGMLHATRPAKELLLGVPRQLGGCGQDRGGRRDPGEAPRAGTIPDAAGRRHDQVAQVRAETFRPAEELSAVNDAKPDRVLDGDDQEVAEIPAVPEPLLGEGDQVDVTVDRSRHVQPALEVEAEPEIALGEDRAVTADARGASTIPGTPRQRLLMSSTSMPAASMQDRTPSSTRSRMTEAG